ncbi:hypothetical protein ACRAWD_15985 [Caulobacter segnis]
MTWSLRWTPCPAAPRPSPTSRRRSRRRIEKGWLYASLMFQASKVRTGHLVFGMLKTPTLRNALFSISPEFRKIAPDTLADSYDQIVAGSAEVGGAPVVESCRTRRRGGRIVRRRRDPGQIFDRSHREGSLGRDRRHRRP